MKYLFLLFIILNSITIFSQDCLQAFPLKDNRPFYSDEIKVKGASKEKLFFDSITWASGVFNSHKEALQSQDKEAGFLLYQSFFSVRMKVPGSKHAYTNYNYWFNAKFEISEERLGLEIFNIEVRDNQGTSSVQISEIKPDERYMSKKFRAQLAAQMISNCQEANNRFQRLIDDFRRNFAVKAEKTL